MSNHPDKRLRVEIEGIVQGVGFRPFVYQLAQRFGLAGWVRNDSRGVCIEAEGQGGTLEDFLGALHDELPPLASLSRFETADVDPQGGRGFAILASDGDAERTAQVSPDTFVCPDCLEELFDPDDRRHRYPFINCTNCGPRFTIVKGIPYDRPNTTMDAFPLCPQCLAEYENPASRRFHAQPNACPACGPQLCLRDASGAIIEAKDPAATTADLLKAGKVVAVKGLGGYHLAVDAHNDAAVAELRRRKARDEKPFALMSLDAETVSSYCELGEAERRLLESVERPIVLLRKRPGQRLAAGVAPGNGFFGVMLPSTPLHYLLLDAGFTALVMTSANRSDEPIAYSDADALERLAGIADAFLCHDRQIYIRTDDSIARVMAGRPLLLRRARGYAPRAVALPAASLAGQRNTWPAVLAVGAELKNTVCLTRGDRAYLSQHIGDLKNAEVCRSLEQTVEHFRSILELQPQLIAHDLHPDYLSTAYAEAQPDLPKVAVQHHHAHLASCLAENGRSAPVIGVIFDGIGYGSDGTIWGGEFLVGDFCAFRRAGHLRTVAMPGGDAATREPFRMALSWLFAAYGQVLPALPMLEAVKEAELRLFRQMVEKGLNSPPTSSCGRLFDAVAALCGLRRVVSYEGQAALELEMAIGALREEGAYPFGLEAQEGAWVLDPAPMIRSVVEDVLAGAPAGLVSARFHNGLAAAVVRVCERIRQETGLSLAALSGGVFQNLYLTEQCVARLEEAGFEVLTHSLVPPNDGGLSLGQAAVAGALWGQGQ